jgi:small subunit ribosomal protein S4
MILGPKYKICKRLGSAIFEKCQTQKFLVSEARSAKTGRYGGGRGGGSDFRRQLIEKQKARLAYGIGERQLKRYVNEANIVSGKTPVESLIGKLEERLDNVVYRLGLASTRRLGRQLVSHGHITVNGRKVTVPSYQTKIGDKIAVREGSRSSVLFQNVPERLKEYRHPQWLSFDTGKLEAVRTGTPAAQGTDINANLSSVFEFYSR